MHKNSTKVNKSSSKIRIIHIFAPQIIKTDASNFRELVQRLTGKPRTDDDERNRATKKPKVERIDEEPISRNVTSNFQPNYKKKMGMRASELGFREKIKGEDEIWRDANTGGGFLGGFGEIDDHGFMQEFNDHFTFMEGAHHNQMDVFEKSQVA